MTNPSRPKLAFDYHNSILLKMTPKLSKLELTIISIMDAICKGNKKKGTCCLSISELSEKVSYRMPGHSVNPGSVKTARKKLQKRGLLIQTGIWERKKVFTTVIPRAEVEGFKGLQIPLEAATSPHLTQAAKLIFGRIHYLLTVNDEQRIYINWSDSRLSDDLNIGLSQTIRAIALLKTHGYLVIRNGGSRCRELGLHPEWNLLNKSFLPQFEQRIKTGKGDKTIGVNPMKGDKTIGIKSSKAISSMGYRKPNKYLKDNKYNFLSGNLHEPGGSVISKQTSICQNIDPLPDKTISCLNRESDVPRLVHNSKGREEPMVYQRSVDRMLQHWNLKGKPLVRHKVGKTAQYKRIVRALKNALTKYSEKSIMEAIDLYHECLCNPSLTLYRYRNVAPTKVSLDEFFEFGVDSLNLINVYKIETLRGLSSWFEILRKGEKAINDRFGIVPEDRFPVVTDMLKRVIGSWDGHPLLSGNIAEKQLRKASIKLVEFHQRIKPRITDHRTLLKASTPAFLKENLIPYILNNLDLGNFKIYWLMSDNFFHGFERHLVEMNSLSKPILVRHLKRRAGADDNKGISRGSRGRTAYRYWDDSERDLSSADF